jgi:heterotetrameric sarcosine oxidase gamma subunit
VPKSDLFRSAFEGHQSGARANAQGQIGLNVVAQRCAGVYLLSTWISGVAAFEQALAAALGSAPLRTGQVNRTLQGLLMRTGPEELMLVASDGTDRLASLRQHIGAEVGAVTDLSHARCCIRINGQRCRTVLGKLFALDFREREFPLGEVRLTGNHHVPVTLHRLDVDAFDLYVFTTYAHDQLGTLLDAALEYGVDLKLQSVHDHF